MLRNRTWRRKYTPDDGNLVEIFYVPALEDSKRYDRLTGYFNAHALTLAARGIEGLIRNSGRMRLVTGCTLGPCEIKAIERGKKLRGLVEQHLTSLPLEPWDAGSFEALELLAWMVARRCLDVKVAVPCSSDGTPIPADGIFHEKTGIIEDCNGDKIAWTGSLNETAAGWRYNWESISVYTSWGPEPRRVADEESSFARIWANPERKPRRVIILDVPDAVRQDLMRFMPKSDKPARLEETCRRKHQIFLTNKPHKETTSPRKPVVPSSDDLRSRVWSFIRNAPALSNGGEQVGVATAAVNPWPHQVRAFDRLYNNWPPKLLIADEVGLGKTIQAGMLLRQAWLAGRLKRILILVPKAVLKQWQIELHEKFNLNWPVYDDGKLTWYPSPAWNGRNEKDVGRDDWHHEPVVIASSHLMRREDRTRVLLQDAEPWDLVILDEAHHARRRSTGSQQENRPNALLRLMRRLKDRTKGLVLLTATPMQVHPIEVWDLLSLLGIPEEWSAEAFLEFHDAIEQPSLTSDSFDRLARLFLSTERTFGEIDLKYAQHLTELPKLKAKQVLRALRDDASIPRRQLGSAERSAAIKIIRTYTPLRQLVSRHTRELLRRYFKEGLLVTPIADRKVEDRFVEMTTEERTLYDTVENYIISTYNQANTEEQLAVGFVMTIYRRRIASSFNALHKTLRKRRDAIVGEVSGQLSEVIENIPDDEATDDVLDADEVARLERAALAAEEAANIDHLVANIGKLPPDSKLESLSNILRDLHQEGYVQVMVFTQYTDTMDFLREKLRKDHDWKLMCFSGRGGEIPEADGSWRRISRDDAKRRFRDGSAEILLCTDAAAEGLNFQFCGALVNYDMPWNPMRVEQRIGRIDRLGQQYRVIRIVNLHYEGTVETDVYRALRDRIDLFETVVGRLQPILARLPGTISQAVLAGESRNTVNGVSPVAAIEQQTREREGYGFDIDAITESDILMPERPPSSITMEDLDRILGMPDMMPPASDVRSLGIREYGLMTPNMTERLRVTTNPEYFEEHAESVELWSPGNVLFTPPEFMEQKDKPTCCKTLKEILDSRLGE